MTPDRLSGGSRAEALDALLDHAFEGLMWISEYPNRHPIGGSSEAETLAEHARKVIAHIEQNDPDSDRGDR